MCFSRCLPIVLSSLLALSVVSLPADAAVPAKPKQTVKAQNTVGLPAPVVAQLKKFKIPEKDISVVAIPLDGNGPTVRFNAETPRQPASIEKVVTSAAALELLGPAKVFSTIVAADKEAENGVLKSDVYLIGKGDPFLTIERFWLLMDDLKSRGIKRIEGNIVLDRSHFDVAKHDAFAFDGDGNRPYNLGADALLINARSLIIKIRPNPKEGVAYLYPQPSVKGITIPKTIALSKQECGAWRKQMNPDYSDPRKPRFNGKFPAACGNKDLLYTTMDADDYAKTLITSFWSQNGITWKGKLVTGKVPEEHVVLASNYSWPVAQLIYFMNKYSNNLMARQLFLALGTTAKDEPKTLEAGRTALKTWTDSLGIADKELFVDNGSGLSRTSRMSAQAGAKILTAMWNSPLMPEFISSLPISGIDGTMRKRHAAQGFAHIKTGYIENVRSIAGYVQTKSGHHYAVVAIVNGNGAKASVPVLDSVINWIHNEC